MPKGGAERAQHAAEFGENRARQLGTNLRTGTLEPQLQQFRDFYMQSVPKQMQDYDTTMSGYQDFAKTGGFTPQGIAAMRSRALSPSRAVYQNALRNVERQRTLQGGYSPGFGTLTGRLAREQSQSLSDASTNVEASLAQMIQQGRLAGLGGATSLYGTTPAQSALFGNQVLNATGQLTGAVGNEMGMESDFIRNRIAQGQMMGRGQHALSNIGDIARMGAGVIYPWMGLQPGQGN